MKKISYILIFTVIFLVVIFQIIVINNLFQQITRLKNDSGRLTHYIEILKNNAADSWKYEQVTLNIGRIVDEDGENLNKGYFDDEQPILIFRFSKLNCSTVFYFLNIKLL